MDLPVSEVKELIEKDIAIRESLRGNIPLLSDKPLRIKR